MTETATETADDIAAALADDIDAGFVALFSEHRSLLFSTALRVSGTSGKRLLRLGPRAGRPRCERAAARGRKFTEPWHSL